jgi:hypothetical protein
MDERLTPPEVLPFAMIMGLSPRLRRRHDGGDGETGASAVRGPLRARLGIMKTHLDERGVGTP